MANQIARNEQGKVHKTGTDQNIHKDTPLSIQKELRKIMIEKTYGPFVCTDGPTTKAFWEPAFWGSLESSGPALQ